MPIDILIIIISSKIMTFDKINKKNSFKKYDPHYKFEIVMKVLTGISQIKPLSRETGIDKHTIRNWRDKFLGKAVDIFVDKEESPDKQEVKKDKLISRQEKEILLLKKLLEHYKKTRSNQSSRSPDNS